MAKIMVTGVNGFVGHHLVQALKDEGHSIIGVGNEPEARPEIIKFLDSFFSCDLTEVAAVNKLPLGNINAIINLAGLANVGDSFDKAALYKSVNVRVLSVIGEALLRQASSARLLAVSTGAVYDQNQKMPLTEKSRLIRGGSPYAQSKILMEKTAADLRNQGLDCIVVRPFNHIGLGQAGGFLLPDLYAKVSGARDQGGVISVGNLSTRRDYTDVRDIVMAYIKLVFSSNLKYDTYNICSGVSHSGQQILELLLQALGLAGQIKVKVDQSLLRPGDPVDLVGSPKRLEQDTGWQPSITLEQTIQDFVAGQS